MMDARTWDRHVVDRHVDCMIGTERESVFLYDLSIGGCMVELARPRAMGERAVVLNLHGTTTARGQAVWQEGLCVGVRFDQPICEAVVRRLGFTPPTVGLEAVSFREPLETILPPLR